MLAKVAHDAVMVLKIVMKVVALMQRPVLETSTCNVEFVERM
jgi:hypothetical protein